MKSFWEAGFLPGFPRTQGPRRSSEKQGSPWRRRREVRVRKSNIWIIPASSVIRGLGLMCLSCMHPGFTPHAGLRGNPVPLVYICTCQGKRASWDHAGWCGRQHPVWDGSKDSEAGKQVTQRYQPQ